MEIFGLILIGTAAGCFAEKFLTGKGFGVIADLIFGVIGALIGGAVFEKTGILTGSSLIGSLIFAATGAFVLLYGVRRVKRV
ncbi:MAG: GlsB/YeaQ/YmgE family stress response membrane protein [Desulfobacteraceae bacterium]|jgi:uncharacterized membrane protein YeaQ/YmgE (transglycosylase-associated protein family)